jgi:hypothetical protein
MATNHSRAHRRLLGLVVVAAACSSDVDQRSPANEGGGGSEEVGDCSSVVQGQQTICECIWPGSPKRDIRCTLRDGDTHAICNCSSDDERVDVCDLEAGSISCGVTPGRDYGCCESAFE